MVRPLAGCLALGYALSAQAWVLEGTIEAQLRHFYAQSDDATSASLALRPQFRQDWDRGRHRIEGELFQRLDSGDASRTHGDVRSLYYQRTERSWEASIGLRRAYWGVTESRQLVDILNQADFVEDLDAEDKLGQPVISASWISRDAGSFDVFLLPYQRARTFPGVDGHPRIPFPVDAANARYEDAQGQRHLDRALRWRGRFGPLDVNLSLFDGTAREPDLLPCLRQGSDFEGTDAGPNCDIASGFTRPDQPLPDVLIDVLQGLGLVPSDEAQEQAFIEAQTPRVLANLVLVPDYARLQQLGVDAQYLRGGWALKLEALWREQRGERSGAAVGGFEYTLPRFFNTGWDVGLLAEYLYDERRTLINARFDNDVFIGSRVGFNDVAGTQLLAGFFVDRRGDDQLLQIEASRRLGADWRARLKFRHFEQVPGDDFTAFIDDEDMVSLSLERFF
jgi:hypothetical protein